IGSCLAAQFIKLGHSVAIANSRGPESLQELAEETGAEAATVAYAGKNKHYIIVAIPQKNIRDIPEGLFNDLPENVVVIDTGNYYPALRDGVIPSLEQSGLDSLWVQQQLGVPVVKVFNSIFATSLNLPGRPKGDKDRIALAVSGDSAQAKAIAFRLVDELGYDPFDIGTIADSWKQQPGSTIYCRDIRLDEVKKRVDAMGTNWSEMRDTIIGQHQANEAAMAADFPAWLKAFKD
ncbi:NAD(P)-binding domain-containing protein, partial [Mucilaginibacter sp.]|uniref:NADPH-dependent F420 reductase n=1 Tax=Mucilaginibacter sp. TaxID=1882438 RepID=UPI002608CD0D